MVEDVGMFGWVGEMGGLEGSGRDDGAMECVDWSVEYQELHGAVRCGVCR